jgi:hypothetical protein
MIIALVLRIRYEQKVNNILQKVRNKMIWNGFIRIY